MGAVSASKYTVMAGWQHVPHLTEAAKAELLASTMPHLRKARSEGIPSLGAGAIYPVPWEDVTCAPFAIPGYWKRGYGFDVGWNRTAAIWLAEDPVDHTIYAYSEHYRGQAVPVIHAAAVRARGEWIMGAIDPAARGREQVEGRQLLTTYRELGLNVVEAINGVDHGLYEVWQRLETGRLKFFNTLQYTRGEYGLYRRDERGRIVKENDHLMDALRYGIATWQAIGRQRPPERAAQATAGPADQTAGY